MAANVESHKKLPVNITNLVLVILKIKTSGALLIQLNN